MADLGLEFFAIIGLLIVNCCLLIWVMLLDSANHDLRGYIKRLENRDEGPC